MPTFDRPVGAATLRLIVNLAAQDTAANSSLVSWELQLICTNGSSWNANATAWSANIGGVGYSGGFTFDFRRTNTVVIASASTWLGHSPSGSLTINVSGWIAHTGTSAIGGPGSTDGNMALPSISRIPPAPTPLGIDQVTARSLRYRFASAGDGGSAIVRWEVQYASNAAFTAAQTITSNGTSTVAGLTPGQQYWFRARGVNGVGAGAWSGASSAVTVLDAPVTTSWAQSGADLIATWTPPAPATGLTGYRFQVATDTAFVAIVAAFTVGPTTTTAVATGLPGGRLYYVRVAALTAQPSEWSAAVPAVLLVLASGDLDRWSRYGVPPAGLVYYTGEGIRRGVVGGKQGLWLESYSTGRVVVAPGMIGIQRSIPTTPGRAYTIRLTLARSADARAHTYQLSAPGISGDPVTLNTDAATPLPPLTWVATSTASTVRVLLAEALDVPDATTPVERVVVTDIRITEAAGYYAARLRGTVYESNLANHFDLACNSVGATWYADRNNLTRFSLPGNALPVSAIFSDRALEGALNYVGIDAGYDTRSMVNVLEATNHGIGDDGLADDPTETVENPSSISLYGPRKDKIDLNLYSLPPYDAAFRDRLADILAASFEPARLIGSVTWNAQQDMTAAAALELTQRCTVQFRDTVQDSQLIGLEHTITPTRWLVTARFIKL